MQFALLGPIGVGGAAGPLEINGTLRRTLLAALLLRANEVVSADELADVLWGDRPSVSATTSLYNQLMRLRQALGPDAGRIRAVPPGYIIDVEHGELDIAVFAERRAAAAEAARSGDWAASAQEYAAALALWRGEPLADVPALHSSAAVHQLGEERILAIQGRIEADLHLARHDQVIGELRTLIDLHPWREAFHGQLMLALYRAGRQAEALDVYRNLRHAVAEEFGVEPSENVRDLHDRLLQSDATLSLAPQPSAGQPAAVRLPGRVPTRQLPPDTRAFTGREAELEALIATARGKNAATPTVVVSAINGMGGIGKTTLAVRAAHSLTAHYPDGQLFIDLHGHSADLSPVSSQDALDYLLRSIGVEAKAIPQEPGERAAFYRSRLAGTKTLVVLDNARDPAQIKPLIPAEPDCLVIVTSRNQLTALDDADFLRLDALPPDEALALLANAAGPGRVDADDPAARQLTQWCGRLPLAIRIIGARLRHRPLLSPESLMASLRADGDPLALLKDEDRDITRVFASSLAVLPADQQQLFTRLGLVPGPDFDALAAAALQDTDVAEAERQLDSLLDHSLLIQHAAGRYHLHDLLRAYARSRAGEVDTELEDARSRLLDYYVETASAAHELWLHGVPGPRRVTSRAYGVEDSNDAKTWFEAERENLIAAFNHEALDGQRKIELSANLAPYLRRNGPWDVTADLLLKTVELANRFDDTESEACALRDLGSACSDVGKQDDAIVFLNRALEIHRKSGNRLGEAQVLQSLSWAFVSTESSLALDYAYQSLKIYREVRPADAAPVLHSLAVIANQTGRIEEGVKYAEMLMDHAREAGQPALRGFALFSLSHAFYFLGRFDEIEPALTEALEAFRGSRRSTAGVIQEFGRLRMLRGQYAEASEYLEKALQEFTELGFALGMSYAYGELARIDLKLGDPDAAMAKLGGALRLALDSGQLYAQSFVRMSLGYAHIARGELSAADEQLRLSLKAGGHGGYHTCRVEAQVGLCVLAHVRDGAAAALSLYREVLESARETRHPREEAAALVGLGRCELETGDRESGAAHVREAIALYRRMGSALDVAETERYLVSPPSPNPS
ncbi:AfsR/SARP family transcriptional regulator [Actinospica robiniae]|uniref:AfsR/SARP family transcriptional regulator n=1 Tax=Actinospica robiniae TaxID=304901 RepID=UPI00041B0FCB|nr:BTAD domain-containing putative transcriptional regulator [Actinospica robiniae]